jgi:hypothetical protein
MKYIVFDENREVLNESNHLSKIEPYSLDEVRWDGGGAGNLEGHYVISDDEEKLLEDFTEQEILDQLRYQAKLDLARFYQDRRIFALANSREDEEDSFFQTARESLDSAVDFEGIEVAIQTYKNRER